MISIVVYVGGTTKIRFFAIEYINPLRFSFPENADTRFDNVRTMIYRCFGVIKS